MSQTQNQTQNENQNQTQGTREIVLDKERDARDVFEFNGFWATAPSQVRLVYEEELSNGLWQLILYDMKRPDRSWRVGSYIDGYEGRRTLYDMTLALSYGGYIDDSEETRKYDVTKNIIWESGGVFVINLPDEWRPDVVIRIPALCGARYPLAEPVYLGTIEQGHFYALDCAGGIQYFNTLDELEAWIREQECPEGHEHPVIHWWEWHITVDGRVVYSEYVQPSPQEVIDALRRHLRPT